MKFGAVRRITCGLQRIERLMQRQALRAGPRRRRSHLDCGITSGLDRPEVDGDHAVIAEDRGTAHRQVSISAGGMGKPPSPAMIEKRSMLRRRRAPLSRRKEVRRSWSGLASSILRRLEHAYGLNKDHRALQRAIGIGIDAPQSHRTRGRLGTFTVPASIRTFDGHGCCRWFSRDPPSRRAQHRCSMQ
jgi:hypothetical protein